MFISPRFLKFKGKEIKLPGSTATLSKLEFMDYIERVRSEVAERERRKLYSKLVQLLSEYQRTK